MRRSANIPFRVKVPNITDPNLVLRISVYTGIRHRIPEPAANHSLDVVASHSVAKKISVNRCGSADEGGWRTKGPGSTLRWVLMISLPLMQHDKHESRVKHGREDCHRLALSARSKPWLSCLGEQTCVTQNREYQF